MFVREYVVVGTRYLIISTSAAPGLELVSYEISTQTILFTTGIN